MIKLQPKKSRENLLQDHVRPVDCQGMPENWLDLLIDTWSTYLKIPRASLSTHFIKHIGPESSYSRKDSLTAGLKEIFLCLNDQPKKTLSAQEKQMLVWAVSSDIEECTPGFHDRIVVGQQFLQVPCSIERLMLEIRTELVDKSARLISSDVHDHNKIFLWAKSIYGVNVPNENDPYINLHPNLEQKKILSVIEQEFNRHYQPLQLISLIEEKLLKILENRFAYQGFREDGYGIIVYSAIFQYLATIFVNPKLSMKDFFVFDDDIIQDIKWVPIRRSILEYLIQQNILICSSDEQTLLSQYIAGEKSIHEHFLDLINNEFEFLSFIQMFFNQQRAQSIEACIKYLKKVPAPQVTFACVNMLQFAKKQKHIFEILQEVNSRFPLAKFMLEEGEPFSNFLINGIETRKQLSALLSLLEFLSSEQLTSILRQRTVNRNNSLMLAIRRSQSYFQELIEFIQPRIDQELMYELLYHSDINNENVLMLSYKEKKTSHEIILSVIKSLEPKKRCKILSQTNHMGFHCLDMALSRGEAELNALIELIKECQPDVLPELMQRVNINGHNFLGTVIRKGSQFCRMLLPLLEELNNEQLLNILQQNNEEAEHALHLCALYCPDLMGNFLNLLQQKLDTVDAETILTKRTRSDKTLLHIMIESRYEGIEDFLNYTKECHPLILIYLLNFGTEMIAPPIFGLIEKQILDMRSFSQFIKHMPARYQYSMLTATNAGGYIPYAVALMYKPEQAYFILTDLLKHCGQSYAENLFDLFYKQLIKLNAYPEKLSLIFSSLLEEDSNIDPFLKQRFLINLINCVISRSMPSSRLNFVTVFMNFVQTNDPDKVHSLLDMIIDCSNEDSNGFAGSFLQNFLMALRDQPDSDQQKLIPYLFQLFNELSTEYTLLRLEILQYYNYQPPEIKHMFYNQKDKFGDSIIYASACRDYEIFSVLIENIKSFDVEKQFDILAAKHHLGGNLITNLLIFILDDLQIRNNLVGFIMQFFSLDNKIQRALLTPDNDCHVLVLVIKAIPDFFEVFLSQIKKLDEQLDDEESEKLEHSVMTHFSQKNQSVGLIAAQQKSFEFSCLIDYLKRVDEHWLVDILSQGQALTSEQLFFAVPNQKMTIFSHALPRINVETLKELILVMNRLSQQRQKSILDLSHINRGNIQADVLKVFDSYQSSLEEKPAKRPKQK